MELENTGSDNYAIKFGIYEKNILEMCLLSLAANFVALSELSKEEQFKIFRNQNEMLGKEVSEDELESMLSKNAAVYRFCNDWLSKLVTGYTVIDIGATSETFDKYDKKMEHFGNINFVSMVSKKSDEYEKLSNEQTDEWINQSIITTMSKVNSDATTEKFIGDTWIRVFKKAKQNELILYVSKDWQRTDIKYEIEKTVTND